MANIDCSRIYYIKSVKIRNSIFMIQHSLDLDPGNSFDLLHELHVIGLFA